LPVVGVALDDAAARNALRAAADRAASLIESIDDRNRPVPGLNWSVCDTARHIVIAVRGNVASMNGDTSSLLEHVADVQDYSARMGAMTSGTLAAEPEHDPKTIGELLRSSVDAFLAEAVTRAPDDAVQTPWYGDGASLPVSIDTRLMLAEVVIHGLDIARGLGRPWPISKQEALLILPSSFAMMPRVFDGERAKGVRATFKIRLRGGPTQQFTINDGTLQIAPWTGSGARPDCVLSADPVAFLLLAYGRRGQWPLIAQGRLLSYGRKPWLALSLRSLFVNP
jgi:uncharacterized protein (TIGR03083 family)